MKLDEEDIKAVASARFWRKRQWLVIGGFFIAAFISLLIAGIALGTLLALISPLPLLSFLVYYLILNRQETKAQKALLEEWRAEKEM